MAVVRDDPKNEVQWFVNDAQGGNYKIGKISKNGQYRAPFVTVESKINIAAISKNNKSVKDQTELTIYPVPHQVKNLKYKVENGKILLSWSPVSTNVKGYTIWKRLPIGESITGTIFEMVGATHVDRTNYTYPNDSIRHYQDHIIPNGTEFIIKAFNYKEDPAYIFENDKYLGVWAGWIKNHKHCPNVIYGFGPSSKKVKIKLPSGK